MNKRWMGWLAPLALVLTPAFVAADGLGVEVWTQRGADATYQPGDRMEIEARTSDDAFLMVYEIDAEGYVRLLFPYRGSNGLVEGRSTYRVPPDHANVDLVVQDPVGQCYIVAIASRDPFRELPWYLRPYDAHAENVGYEGGRDDEEGITAEGRIVGDPFVAMERIRRLVLEDPEDDEAFGTAYASYYVHTEVKYPRYLCYDCHRPGRWAWWAGFDPYYTSCSVFEARVNWGWGWGPSYWFGYVPYYYYVTRHDCPPHYRRYGQDRSRFSSWDGWKSWQTMWGTRLVRYKTPPPAGYVPPPPRFRTAGGANFRDGKPAPPGFVVSDRTRGGDRARPRTVVGRNFEERRGEPDIRGREVSGRGSGNGAGRPTVERLPGRETRPETDGDRVARGSEGRERARPLPRVETRPRDERGERIERPARETRPLPRSETRPRDRGERIEPPAREERGRRYEPPAREERSQRSEPRYERPRSEPPPRSEPRYERPRSEPRVERPRSEPKAERPREERPADSDKGQRNSPPPRDDRRETQRGGSSPRSKG